MADNPSIAIDEKLLHATVKLNTLLFAGVSGLVAGLSLLCMTYLALYVAPPGPGRFLSVLGVFLPGYAVSPEGGWVGFLWGGLLGAISGATVYRVYARSIRRQVADYFAGNVSPQSLDYVVLRIYGHPLGVALGGVAALGVLITTNWLTVVGGAGEKRVHAELLSHYLPGYSLSFAGSVLGAIEIFVITYLYCLLLGAIYNRVAAFRQNGAGS